MWTPNVGTRMKDQTCLAEQASVLEQRDVHHT
jgi:hypothetical protein